MAEFGFEGNGRANARFFGWPGIFLRETTELTMMGSLDMTWVEVPNAA